MKSAALVGLLVGFIFTVSSLPTYAWEIREPVYLSPHLFDGASADQVLPPMPKPGSPEDKADFAELHRYQDTRTAQDCERAVYERHLTLENEFGPKYGPLTEKETKAWGPFFEKLAYETDYFVQKLKKRYPRPRPYVTDPKLRPCVKKEETGAYPSGHSAITRVFALTLDQLDPARKAAFDARGNRIAEDRVLGGVHHPSDIEGGKKLGDQIFSALNQNEKFQKELKALKLQKEE
jgi:acid phosphatase (class A)